MISQKRLKELSIHKINGAKSRDLLLLLNRSTLIILTASFAVATPVAWYSMNNWLEGFAYKSDIGIWIYFASGILVSVVTLTVVSWQGWRFAKVNPVDGLRYE